MIDLTPAQKATVRTLAHRIVDATDDRSEQHAMSELSDLLVALAGDTQLHVVLELDGKQLARAIGRYSRQT